MKNNIFCALIFLLFSRLGDAAEVKDLDGDGIADRITTNISGESASVAIESSRSKTTKKFYVTLVGECGVFEIYPAVEKGAIFLDQSCGGRQAQVDKDLYLWNEPANSWVLHKTIHGEAMDQADGILPSLVVQRAECCLVVEKNNEQAKIKENEESIVEINRALELISKTFKDDGLLTASLKGWTFEMSVELSAAITDKNIGLANDFAYYLWRKSRFTESAIILEKVILKNPDRVVAILNLADSLWDFDADAFKERAKGYYKSYDEKMRAAGKVRLIPARVVERISI